MRFIEKLRAAQTATRSCLCIGLDPDFEKMPPSLGRDPRAILTFCKAIIDSTADVVSAFKPNLAFFLSQANLDILREVIAYIPATIPTILDAKFGDMGNTAEHYAKFAFAVIGADAVTVSPYLGTDAIRPFLAYNDKLVFVLSRTSNTDGNEFQSNGDSPLYITVAQHMSRLEVDYPGQIGLVVGATQPDDMIAIRNAAPKLPFLVPGVGAQGGDLEAVLRNPVRANGLDPVISVSRAVLYASRENDFAEAARQKILTLRAEIEGVKKI